MSERKDLNSHDAIVNLLSNDTLRDIEGLDPSTVGFGRSECCGPVPSKLAGSMAFTDHLFLATDIPVLEWGPKTENIPGHAALEKRAKSEGGLKLNVFHRPGPDACMLRFTYDEALETLLITQYSCITDGELPWESKGALAIDRSNEVFVFVCAHRSRDERCGYCGAVLVDLLRRAIKAKSGEDAKVHVYPCSHLGSHVYAGNVLVYSKAGGVCFGCFTPADIDVLVETLCGGHATIPASLEQRVRGRIGYNATNSKCSIM